MQSPSPGWLVGQVFGKCRLVRYLGKGDLSCVYQGEHLFLHRTVALKVASSIESSSPALIARFQEGARVAAMLDHPNIVRVYDVDEQDGRPYLVMEHVDGEDLQAILSAGKPLAVAEAVRIVREAALALRHAHAVGIHHANLTAANILRAADGRVKLTDFGLGDPSGKPSSTRSDLFALGLVFVQALTGRRHRGSPRVPNLELDLAFLKASPGYGMLLGVIRRLLAVRPSDRYAHPLTLLRDLALLQSRAAPLRPQGRFAT